MQSPLLLLLVGAERAIQHPHLVSRDSQDKRHHSRTGDRSNNTKRSSTLQLEVEMKLSRGQGSQYQEFIVSLQIDVDLRPIFTSFKIFQWPTIR